MDTWMQVAGVVIQVGILVWMFFFLALARREHAWWKRLGELYGKVPDFLSDYVRYLRKGMPRNAEACRKSADQTIAEIGKMTDERNSQNKY